MSVNDIHKMADKEMEEAHDHLVKRFSSLQTGRVSPEILNGVVILVPEMSPKPMALSKVGSISIQGRALVIKGIGQVKTSHIEQGINKANIGLTAQSKDGAVYVQVPSPTGETRTRLAKEAKQHADAAKVAIRQVRQDAQKKIRTFVKAEGLPDSVESTACKKLDELTKEKEKKVDATLASKTKEITTV